MGYVFRGDRNRGPGFRIAAISRLKVVQAEASETTDFDSIALRKGAPDGVEDFPPVPI